jgi:predicted nucleotidyltransferase
LAVNWDQFKENAAVRPSEVLPQHRETIRQLVIQAGMANPRVFGSVLHGDDQDGSDLDLLVDPAPRASLLTIVSLQSKLEEATGIKIDLRTPGELHPRFRSKVLAEAASL